MAGAKVEEEVPLPGFRFHPTDEELVGFYLAGQVDGRTPARIDHLIKNVDIYKYNPWDLPKANEEAGDKECLYFFCKRGRKYNNSVRPNRVTGTGFWKATGIDKPVYNKPPEGEGEGDCLVIGLKKTLVYYCGSAGKGTKTAWMMHEFRLPPPDTNHDSSDIAEVWTVCKIFKRDVMQKRYASGWRETTTNNKLIPANQQQEHVVEMGSTCYISFGSLPSSPMALDQETTSNNLDTDMMGRSLSANASCPSNNCITKVDHDFTYDEWDELRSVVGCAFDHSSSHQVQYD